MMRILYVIIWEMLTYYDYEVINEKNDTFSIIFREKITEENHWKS